MREATEKQLAYINDLVERIKRQADLYRDAFPTVAEFVDQFDLQTEDMTRQDASETIDILKRWGEGAHPSIDDRIAATIYAEDAMDAIKRIAQSLIDKRPHAITKYCPQFVELIRRKLGI